MEFLPGSILPEVILITLESKDDQRGSFTRTYCETEFRGAGLPTHWMQCNHTVTKEKGTIRGLHWQAEPKGEDKLIRCLSGTVFDVAVDIRPDSLTFGRWEAFELSEDTSTQLFIPKGFAHGFQCLTDNCHLFYQMTEFYDVDLARGFRWDDAEVGTKWPLELQELSRRDKGLPCLSEVIKLL